jgi:hypothetical protein
MGLAVLRAFVLLVGALAVWVVLDNTLSDNQLAGVYPPDADSISIPLFSHLFTLVFLSPFYLTVAWLPVSPLLRPLPTGRTWAQLALLAWLALSYTFTLDHTLVTAAMWGDGLHDPVVSASRAFLCVQAAMLAVDVYSHWRSGLLRPPQLTFRRKNVAMPAHVAFTPFERGLTTLLVALMLSGLGAILVCGWYLGPEWRALEHAVSEFALATRTSDPQRVHTAAVYQDIHRLNCFAEGIGVGLGAILAAVSATGLVLHRVHRVGGS